jgi:hypothetical protein
MDAIVHRCTITRDCKIITTRYRYRLPNTDSIVPLPCFLINLVTAYVLEGNKYTGYVPLAGIEIPNNLPEQEKYIHGIA